MSSLLTIVICTFDRGELLKDCLQSLSRQSDQDFNVIVVDNGITAQTRDCLSAFESQHSGWLLERCADPGLSYARNYGAKVTETEWLGYLDDDAIVETDFISQVKKVLLSSKFDAFGGIYDPWYREGRKSWFSDRYGSNRHAYSPLTCRELHAHEFFSGGIAFYKKEVIASAGWFDPELGMKAGTVSYGEETALQSNLRSGDYRLGIAPSVMMQHLVAGYKLSLKWQVKSQYRRGVAAAAVLGGRKKSVVIVKMLPKAVFAVLRIRRRDYASVAGCLLGIGVEFLRQLAFQIGTLEGGQARGAVGQ